MLERNSFALLSINDVIASHTHDTKTLVTNHYNYGMIKCGAIVILDKRCRCPYSPTTRSENGHGRATDRTMILGAAARCGLGSGRLV